MATQIHNVIHVHIIYVISNFYNGLYLCVTGLVHMASYVFIALGTTQTTGLTHFNNHFLLCFQAAKFKINTIFKSSTAW